MSQEELITQGFVTVEHDLKLLKLMSTTYPHVIAKHEDKVVGYALVMLPDFADHIEILKPMFRQFNKVVFQNKKLDLKTSMNTKVLMVKIERSYLGDRGKQVL